MQTTLITTLVKSQSNFDNKIFQLDEMNTLLNRVERKLYADYQKYFKKNNDNKLRKEQINYLKSLYQKNFNINARQFNSIKMNLDSKIQATLELTKDYIEDTKENIKKLEKDIKAKKKSLEIHLKNNSSIIDKKNIAKLKTKIYYLNKYLNKQQNKLNKLLLIDKTGNVHLCFGSKKLFNNQFNVNSDNLVKFKNHKEWLKAWQYHRNKTFVLVGSSDETCGNTNCQLNHIKNNIYELKLNINPKAIKLTDRYTTFQIEIHNDKNQLIKNILNGSCKQAITYRFYKDIKCDNYKIFINIDKAKQRPSNISYKQLGAIGIDINIDHLAITEINHHGNLLKCWNIQLDFKNKTNMQSLNIISLAIKEVIGYAAKVNKPIVIEKLDFSQKKKELKNSYNKQYNKMLSNFAYKKIIQLLKSRCFDKGIEIVDVPPNYTSKIGKFKYQNKYKLTTHQAASLVIARRGLLSYTKEILIKDKKGNISKKNINVVNTEKTISNQNSKHYFFELPARNIQRENNFYWKEIEQNYLKAKQYRLLIKRKIRTLNKKLLIDNLILKSKSTLYLREITVVTDSSGGNSRVYHNSKSELKSPF